TEVEAKPPTPKAVKESTGTGPVALKEPEKAPEDSAPRSIASDASGPLHLVSSDGKKDIVLDKPSITIGREEGDIVLGGDTAASRLHAQISKDDEGRVYVEDLGSTNGTWVNQHRVGRKVELHRGDWLQVGETTFQLR
ncbi:MAG: FHA domain-containing protein, partial [Thermoleophilia bacterium]|nr:FHA domain-containing protein [Thermoleophilia bacterium]